MESTESKDLKLLFIEEELSQHGEWLCDVFIEAIETQKLKRTEDLVTSIDYQSFKSGEDPGLKVNFLSYGRAFEIADNKKKNRFDVNTNRDIWGIRNRERSRKKDKRWYAKNMYGGLNKLISRIMYGLSDEEIARLKGILENRKLNNNG